VVLAEPLVPVKPVAPDEPVVPDAPVVPDEPVVDAGMVDCGVVAVELPLASVSCATKAARVPVPSTAAPIASWVRRRKRRWPVTRIWGLCRRFVIGLSSVLVTMVQRRSKRKPTPA
jgi:hypothetical protein